jgi:hypothetical protein
LWIIAAEVDKPLNWGLRADDMRADHQLERLRSLHVYSFSDVVYDFVLGANGLDDDEIFADFLDNPVKALTPHKDTLLHEFIRSALYESYAYALDKFPDLEVGSLKFLLQEAEMECPSWMTPAEIEEHLDDADKLVSQAIIIMAPWDVFRSCVAVPYRIGRPGVVVSRLRTIRL